MKAMQGLYVFPCWFNKAPASPHGFYDATNDPAVIDLWRKRYFLFGAPTGAVNGFDVLDIDPKDNGDKWLATQNLPETRVHETRSGGRHYFFKHRPGLQCNESRIAPGVDIRASGGYVIWWPWTGCKVLSDSPIASWPAPILELEATRDERPQKLFRASPVSITGNRLVPEPLYSKIIKSTRGSPGVHQRRVRGILRPLVEARDGRNKALYKAALQFCELIPAGVIARADAEELLFTASVINGYVGKWDADHAKRTIESGLKSLETGDAQKVFDEWEDAS
jgi:hypothetical protein